MTLSGALWQFLALPRVGRATAIAIAAVTARRRLAGVLSRSEHGRGREQVHFSRTDAFLCGKFLPEAFVLDTLE